MTEAEGEPERRIVVGVDGSVPSKSVLAWAVRQPDSPVRRHADGTFGPPVYLNPARFVVAGGLLVNHTPEATPDVRRPGLPPARGASPTLEGGPRLLPSRVLNRPSAQRARPPRARPRGVHPPPSGTTPTWSSFMPGRSQDPDQLDAQLFPIDSLPHPDPSEVVGDGAGDDLCWDLLTRADAVAVTARGTGVASRRRSHADGPTYRRRCPPGAARSSPVSRPASLNRGLGARLSEIRSATNAAVSSSATDSERSA